MKFVLAPDKFKGSLTGREFCQIVGDVLLKVFPDAEIVKVPLADGGDGTLEVIREYLNAHPVQLTVSDPLFRPIRASYLFSEAQQTAFVEMSEASGYRLLKTHELDSMHTSTLGTGELILDAIKKGAAQIFLGIGGSATTDGGMGVAHALGYRFMDAEGKVLSPIGKNLIKVKTIKRSQTSILGATGFKVACDVDNPFYGEHGAAKVYAQQKGASEAEIQLLDEGLKNFAEIVHNSFEIDLQKVPGAGAAGGLGGGATAFLGAELVSGIDLVKEISGFGTKIKGADWIVTGEGHLDSQTFSGKTIGGVLTSAMQEGVPVAAICGRVTLSNEEQRQGGLAYAASLSTATMDLQEAIKNTKENLVLATHDFAKSLKDSR